MSERYFDFDQAMQEVKQEPVVIKIFGEEEELSPSLPASIVLEASRLKKAGIENAGEEQVVLMANSIFGEDRLRRWCDNGLTIAGMEILLKEVVSLYAKKSATPSRKRRRA
jgi:hypothetical protein